MILTFENSRDPLWYSPLCPAPFFLFLTLLMLYDELGVSYLIIIVLLLGKEILFTRFDRSHTVGAHLQRGFLN